MSAPQLTRRLVLESPEPMADGAGGYAQGWVVLGTLWAELRAGAGRGARLAVEVPVGRIPWRITVPMAPPGALARPRPDQRLREGVRVFRILAVAEADKRGAYLTCHCIEEEPA